MAFNYQAALENATQPIREVGRLALANAQLDNERAFTTKQQIDTEARAAKREIDRDERRLSEQKDAERRQYYQSLLARKVDGISKDMDFETLQKLDIADAKATAKTALGFAINSQNRIQQQIDENSQKMFHSINEQATGEQKMAFLRTALSDPTVRSSIDDKSFEQISKLMANTATPDEADKNADKVFDAIKKNTTLLFWGKGGTKAANNFRTIYNQVSQEGLTTAQSTKLKVLFERSKDLGESLEKAQQYSQRVFSEHGRFAPPEMAQLFTGQLPPVTTPPSQINPELFSKVVKTLADPQPPAAVRAPAAPSQPMTGVIPTAINDVASEIPSYVKGAPGAALNLAGSAIADVGIGARNLGRYLFTGNPQIPYLSPEMQSGSINDTPPIPPPTEAEIIGNNPNRATTLYRNRMMRQTSALQLDPHEALKQRTVQFLQQNPNPVLPPYSPGIDQKIKQIGIELGGKESDWPVFTAKIQAGDKAAIATYNVLYQEALSRDSHGTTFGLPPINNN